MNDKARLNISISKKKNNKIKEEKRIKDLLSTIDKDEFEQYYRYHNGEDTIAWCKSKFNKFYLKDYKFLLEYWSIRKRSNIETNNIKIKKMKKNYGVENNFQRDDIKNKCKQIKKEKYNDEYYSNQEKAIKTKLDRYNTTDMLHIEKTNATIINKYGSIESMYKLSAKKREKYYLDNFGVVNPFQVPDIRYKMKKRYKFDGESFDSAPELALWIYAKYHNQDIKHGKDVGFFEYYYNDELHRYFPDFIYNGEYIELKGEQFFKNDGTMCNPFNHEQDELYEAKHQCGLEHGVKFWTNKDYEFVLEWCNNNNIDLKKYKNK